MVTEEEEEEEVSQRSPPRPRPAFYLAKRKEVKDEFPSLQQTREFNFLLHHNVVSGWSTVSKQGQSSNIVQVHGAG